MSFDLRRLKLGPITTPTGAAGNNAVQTVTAAKNTIGPLLPGWYTFKPTKACYVLQGPIGILDAGLNTAALIARGVHVADNESVEFSVDQDGYLAWVRVSEDGTVRINSRSDSRLV